MKISGNVQPKLYFKHNQRLLYHISHDFWGFYNINRIIEKFGGEEKFIEAVHRWYDNYRKGGRTKTPIIK